MTGPAPFIIAEAGVNHNGDEDLVLLLVDAAADAGADAVKFQHFDPARVVAPEAGLADYQMENIGRSSGQREMLEALRLERHTLERASIRAADRGLVFLCTAFDEESADEIADLVEAWKVSSTDLDNLPFLDVLAATGKPLIISSGMATQDEVEETIAYLHSLIEQPAGGAFPPVTLLHCVSAYPAPIAEVNLRAIPMLRDRLGIPVGYSDHTLGIGASVGAAVLGATIIEKHLTLDCALPGPDHKASLEPKRFAEMTRAIREAVAALGEPVKKPQPSEIEHRVSVRRGLYAAYDLPTGHVLKRGDVIALRPATELPPRALPDVLGRRLERPVAGGKPFSRADFGR
jgi:N,N'-diacetyllegionaminate synthase